MSTRRSNETEPSSGRCQVLSAVVASTVGTTIEWYAFFLCGSAAALVFPKLFFPEQDPFVAQLLSYGTFAVGFLSRPLGGIVFSHLGDRKGRKVALVATLLLMGISTLLVGLVPTYERIGVIAPWALVLLRFLQGIAVGGEWGGAVLLALASGHRGKRGFYASWPQAGVSFLRRAVKAHPGYLEGVTRQQSDMPRNIASDAGKRTQEGLSARNAPRVDTWAILATCERKRLLRGL